MKSKLLLFGILSAALVSAKSAQGTLLTFEGIGNLDSVGLQLDIVLIPEPSSLSLLALGGMLLGSALFRQRRRRCRF